MAAHLEVEPVSALADEPVSLRALGLDPRQRATLKLGCPGWQSSATFEADDRGEIDPRRQPPVSGSYEGREPMGLVWSMRAEGLGAPPLTMTPLPDRLELQLALSGAAVDRVFIERCYSGPGVTRREVRDDDLFGVLYEPPGPGPHPVVLLLSGSGGGLSEASAALHASRGFAALALAYFNYGPLQDDLCEIPLEYFESALHWLQRQSRIDPDRIAVRGASRGGELALLLGATFPEIGAVIGVVPSSVCWGSVSGDPERLGRSSWTRDGKPIPFNNRLALSDAGGTSEAEAIALTPGFLQAMKNAEAAHESEIPVERINGPVLLISGGDDEMWPSADFGRRVMSRLEREAFAHEKIHLSYQSAGHLVGAPPYQPTTTTAGLHPVRKAFFSFGGTPKAYAAANVDAWRRSLDFLRRSLAG